MNIMRHKASWKDRRKAQGKKPLFMRDYSPNQPRDENGRWTESGDAIVYHGTSEMFLHSIMKKGLLTKPKHRTFDPHHYRAGTPRNKSVYVSRTLMEAMRWAEHAQNAIYDDISRRRGIAMWPGRAKEAWAGLQHMTHPVVLEIHIPKEEAAKFIPDKKVKDGTAKLFPDNIPPEWIKNAFTSDQEKAWGFNTRDWKKTHLNDAEGDEVFYMVVMIDGQQMNDAGFDPSQERDDNGRWTSEYAHDPDHPVTRDPRGGLNWGSTHFESRSISAAASKAMGIPGYDWPDSLHDSITEQGKVMATKSADTFLKSIWESSGSKEPLYHGFADRVGIQWKPGDTLSLSLTATAGDMDTIGYGVIRPDHPSTPTLFEFPKGTKMSGYAKWRDKDAKEFGYQWQEAITAGKFRVVSVRKSKEISSAHWEPEVTVVRLDPTEYFNPNTKAWEKAQ